MRSCLEMNKEEEDAVIGDFSSVEIIEVKYQTIVAISAVARANRIIT